MKKNTVQFLGLCLFFVIILSIFVGWTRAKKAGEEPKDEARRVIVIEIPEKFGDLERPPVDFDHEAHEAAIKEKGCLGCHLQAEDGALIFELYRISDITSKQQLTDIYHNRCIGCHVEMGEGPQDQDCGLCHNERRDYTLVDFPFELDLRQHHQHVKHFDGDCSPCHHVYDEKQDKLVYKEGQETSCRDCHLEQTTDDTPSMRTVAHQQCVNCHLGVIADSQKAGPFECKGCHTGEEPGPIVTDMSDVPRLDRGQEDEPTILIDNNKLDAVPFKHLSHEKVTRNCRVCHHESLKACDECHTLQGREEGGYVKLVDAYHMPTSTHSCVGCHERETKKPSCIPCHSDMPQGASDSSCTVCHSGSFGARVVARENAVDWWLDADIPDTIYIGVLSDEYEPVEFPHKKIIEDLRDRHAGHNLANTFHAGKPALCMGCHHHSPLGEMPPPCSRCHAEPFDPTNLHKPGLKGAYHQQCVGCHKDMKIGNYLNCGDCHKDFKPSQPKLESQPTQTGNEQVVEEEL